MSTDGALMRVVQGENVGTIVKNKVSKI
jgi:hypothetical protein